MSIVRGPLAAHPSAQAFADEVHRVHKRYASEVVAANRLCPFLRDVETGFGAFVVMLDPGEPSVEATVEALHDAKSPVTHVVFPLAQVAPAPFERFSGRLALALKREMKTPPVMATFHPELVGDASNPHRLIGLLRRAPDPFVQLIPEGMENGGTVFMPLPFSMGHPGGVPHTPPDDAYAVQTDAVDTAEANFTKLQGKIDALMALITEIHADRAATYAPYLAALTQP